MRSLIVVLALILPAASSAEAPPPPPDAVKSTSPARICNDPFKLRPTREPRAVKPRRLDELPPANLYLAVVDEVDGCIEPRLVRQGIGAGR